MFCALAFTNSLSLPSSHRLAKLLKMVEENEALKKDLTKIKDFVCAQALLEAQVCVWVHAVCVYACMYAAGDLWCSASLPFVCSFLLLS